MKNALRLLAATTALGGLFGLTHIATANTLEIAPIPGPVSDLANNHSKYEGLTLLADNDHRKSHDSDDDEGDDDDDDEEDDDDEGGAALPPCPATIMPDTGPCKPAPAGTVAPPANGLFAPGAGPKVQLN